MRKIKFNVWDTKRKYMYHLLEDGWSFGTCEADRAVSWEDVFAEKDTGLIPLQYTGLTDRNGLKIYDGDILSFILTEFNGSAYVDKEVVDVVEYGEAVFEVDGVPLYFAYHDDAELEIIGNIYENKELLGEKLT